MLMSEKQYARGLRKLVPRCAQDQKDDPRLKRMSEADERRLCELWESPMHQDEISKVLGVSDKTLRRFIAELGLPRRVWTPPDWDGVWPEEDNAFVLHWYRRRKASWIGSNLPSGRKVSKSAVIGRHGRLKKKQQGKPATAAAGGARLEAHMG